MDIQSNIQLLEINYNTKTFSHFTEMNNCNIKKRKGKSTRNGEQRNIIVCYYNCIIVAV